MLTRRGAAGAALGLGAGVSAAMAVPAAAAAGGSETLAGLAAELARLPARRDFKSVPAILTDPGYWDAARISAVAAYRGGPKQVWDNKSLAGGWTASMRSALNGQHLSFRHPAFLTVSMTRGDAQLALFDQAMWDKYPLAKLTGGKFARNSFLDAKPGADFSPEDAAIPTLMKRGAVFMSCHNAIMHAAARVAEAMRGSAPVGEIAADLTNHLLPGVILTPGALATLPELQQAGFHYVT